LQKAGLQVSAPEFKLADRSVNSIDVKLPDFWTKEPELWFTQAESNFRHAKIMRSLTKYDYVLQRLLMKVLVSRKELARRVQTGEVADPYEQLEAKLSASYQPSPWQLAFDLLDMPDVGDRRLPRAACHHVKVTVAAFDSLSPPLTVHRLSRPHPACCSRAAFCFSRCYQ
jgi:hypothetical protein